ncbi:CoA transferase [Citricoccus sp. NPDC055426]|uniref:CoA transferase n=1 Tax=Citricoccus sp. NPDC055426 TaxID=3155536 RepID=UPI0034468E7D
MSGQQSRGRVNRHTEVLPDLPQIIPSLADPCCGDDVRSAAQKWESTGAAALTAAGATPPGDVIGRMDSAAHMLRSLAGEMGTTLEVDGGCLLSERARLTGIDSAPPEGRTLRGAGFMLRHPEGWAAYNVARPSDEEALSALTGGRVTCPEAMALQDWATKTSRAEALRTAALLDIASAPVGRPGQVRATPPFEFSHPTPAARPRLEDVRVADFSSLWAGPLAAALLAQGGAQVRRFEAHNRQEAPLPADAPFVQRLNGAKERVLFDTRDRDAIAAELTHADVVIVSARPRALRKLGLVPRLGQIFVRITAHGETGADAERIGFGDDCAVAAGAVGWVEGRPVFAADALADPATGLLAATAVMALLHAGATGVVDLNLHRTASWLVSGGSEQ